MMHTTLTEVSLGQAARAAMGIGRAAWLGLVIASVALMVLAARDHANHGARVGAGDLVSVSRTAAESSDVVACSRRALAVGRRSIAHYIRSVRDGAARSSSGDVARTSDGPVNAPHRRHRWALDAFPMSRRSVGRNAGIPGRSTERRTRTCT